MDTEYRGDAQCALAKAVDIVGERWVFFIVREALAGVSRFAEFRTRLGIAPDVLSHRLALLVDAGVMRRREYREGRGRTRSEYLLTPAGDDLALPILALQQWGEVHTPSTLAGSVHFATQDGDRVSATFAIGEVTPPTVVVTRSRP